MKCVGSLVAEIWPFANSIMGAYGTPILGKGRS